jgi:hypothetical protein
MICAEELGIGIEDIRLHMGDTAMPIPISARGAAGKR